MALTVTYCVTLGESLPFPEPQLPCLERKEGTEKSPKPLPVTAAHTQTIAGGVQAMKGILLAGSSRSCQRMKEPANIAAVVLVLIVVHVISKAVKAGQGLQAENRRPGLARWFGNFPLQGPGTAEIPQVLSKSPPLGLDHSEAGRQMEGKHSPHHTHQPTERPRGHPPSSQPEDARGEK